MVGENDEPVADEVPQPVSVTRLAELSRSSIKSAGQCLRLFQPKQKSAANAVPGIPRPKSCDLAMVEASERVSVDDTAEPEGVTVAGENPQLTSVGCPEHAKETGELKPF